MKNIHEYNSDSNNSNGYYVKFSKTIKGKLKIYQKYFSIYKYKTKEKALEEAIKYRDILNKKLKNGILGRKLRTIPTKRSKSKILRIDMVLRSPCLNLRKEI